MKLACSDDLNLHAEDSADMYRIEISPGEETVLRTVEELATAIRNGLVTARSRVYHNASQKWLPIEFHPHYKKALALPERPKSAPMTTPLPGSVPNFAIKRESAPPPEPARALLPPRHTPVADPPAQPRMAARPSLPLPPAAENLPFIEVEIPPPPPIAVAPPPPPVPAPTPTLAAAAPPPPPAPAPIPAPEPVPMLAPAPAVAMIMAPDAFPSLVQPRSYLPPPFEVEPARSNPLADPAPHLPVASRRARGGRSVLVGGGALALMVVGYLFLTSSRSSQVVAESAPAAAEQKQPPSAGDEDYPAEDTDIPVPQPSAINSAPPRSGPASQAWSSSAGATAPLLPTGPARSPAGTPEPAIVSAPAISPPPANLELSVPKLPGADSLAPAKSQRDTAAIKRILKAVGGP